MIIAIDGPAASGKGTIARALARHFGLPHLDTGLLYRAVGREALVRGIAFDDGPALAELAAALDVSALDPEPLKAGPVGEAASRVAAINEVRQALMTLQRDFATQAGGAVLDGRDIGTVIAPEAQVKIFVTATPEARAQRRHAELVARGEEVTPQSVLDDIRKRDQRDSSRASAPLTKAADAVELDNTTLGPAESVARALEIVASRTE
ncbi:(d)CMP kinase [Ancylobacter pratisalsi]|uniref:Cytidylate kinase n=1 Tax=Ancylobacter pratisalsi TaxID=1745854 RepID=A0A6P1YKV8_9HYPH|nr:(d)CMP kinase [Ancylobacter pratisalsi]QIB33978.1 (d)CMP kinase [Ancylobacter pratisalsi]